MANLFRIQVLMSKAEAERFDTYCRKKGYKKSPLIARLVREHLDKETLDTQRKPADPVQRESEQL